MKFVIGRRDPRSNDQVSRPLHSHQPDSHAFTRMAAEVPDQRSASSRTASRLLGSARDMGARLHRMFPDITQTTDAKGSRPEMTSIARHIADNSGGPESSFFKGGSILHAIARSPDAERNAARAITNVVVRAGVEIDVHKGDQSGEAPLTTAVRKQNIEAAEILKEMGASPGYRDKTGQTPLQLAHRRMAEAGIAMRFSGRSFARYDVRRRAERGDETANEYLQAKEMVHMLGATNPNAAVPRPILKPDIHSQEPGKRVRFAEDPDLS